MSVQIPCPIWCFQNINLVINTTDALSVEWSLAKLEGVALTINTLYHTINN